MNDEAMPNGYISDGKGLGELIDMGTGVIKNQLFLYSETSIGRCGVMKRAEGE